MRTDERIPLVSAIDMANAVEILHADANARVQVGDSFHRAETNVYCNHTLLPSEARKPFSTVPFLPDTDYVERPAVTAWLREKCGRWPSRAALVGLGGIGQVCYGISIYVVY